MTTPKHALRSELRAARKGIAPDARAEAAAAVATRVQALSEAAGVRTVLAYAAMPEELDPAPLVTALRARGVRVAYPRVCGAGELALHWADRGDLVPGYCGVLEPPAGAAEACLDDIDLVLVPGVGFDSAGGRLGMGGGFYDRLLARLAEGTHAIGLAFDEQVVWEVPAEGHDVALDIVVTPTRTLRRAL